MFRRGAGPHEIDPLGSVEELRPLQARPSAPACRAEGHLRGRQRSRPLTGGVGSSRSPYTERLGTPERLATHVGQTRALLVNLSCNGTFQHPVPPQAPVAPSATGHSRTLPEPGEEKVSPALPRGRVPVDASHFGRPGAPHAKTEGEVSEEASSGGFPEPRQRAQRRMGTIAKRLMELAVARGVKRNA